MADIDILVDSTQVKTAKQELSELSNSFNSAAKSAGVFMQAYERAAEQNRRNEEYIRRVSTELRTLINNNLQITNSYKSAEQSAQSFNEVLQNQALLAAKATQALNARLGVTGPKATDQGAGFGAIEQEIERLTVKYNQIYAASRLYEAQLNEINRAHQLGVVSVKQHEDALERLNMEYQAFQNGTAGPMNRFEQNLQQTAGGLNNFGVITQQVGYQVGDFLVQVQSGTNWMVAFGQQATQLVGFLPMLSGSLGVSAAALVGISAGLGIAIPLVTAIGAAWMRTTEQANAAKDAIISLAEAQNRLIASTEDYRQKIEMLKFGADTAEEAVALREIFNITKDIRDLTAQYSAADSLGTRQRLAETIMAKKEELATQQMIVDKLVAAREEYEKTLQKVDLFKTGVSDILGTMTNISQSDISKPFLNALPAVQSLVDKVKEIAGAYDKYCPSGVIPGTAIPKGVYRPGGMDDAARGAMADLPNPFGTVSTGAAGPGPVSRESGSSGSGGGANSDDRIQNELEALYKYLDMVKETETSAYAERQETLKEALDSKIITLTEYQELEKALVEQHNSDLARIESKQQDKRLGEVGKFFGSMASLAQAGGQKYVKIAKVLGATEALINTYVAQSQVLRDPTLGFFGKMAAYASIGAAGLGLVSALQGGGVGGKSGSGGRAGGRGTTKTTKAATAVTPQTVYISGIQPDALFTGEMLSNLFDNFYDENDNRGKVFVVNK